jgi:hypothetical protein
MYVTDSTIYNSNFVAALLSGAGGGPAPVKGLSHEMDFKNFDKKTRPATHRMEPVYGTDRSVKKTFKQTLTTTQRYSPGREGPRL